MSRARRAPSRARPSAPWRCRSPPPTVGTARRRLLQVQKAPRRPLQEPSPCTGECGCAGGSEPRRARVGPRGGAPGPLTGSRACAPWMPSRNASGVRAGAREMEQQQPVSACVRRRAGVRVAKVWGIVWIWEEEWGASVDIAFTQGLGRRERWVAGYVCGCRRFDPGGGPWTDE
jgi:hypothetical protein